MRKWKRILAVSGLCSCAFAAPALASTNLETGSSLAGISVALNNFYAGNTEPEKQLATIYSDMENRSAKNQGSGSGSNKGASSGKGSASSDSGTGTDAQTEAPPKETKAAKPKSSPYDNIAVSKVNGSVNIRTTPIPTAALQARYTTIQRQPSWVLWMGRAASGIRYSPVPLPAT